MAMPGSLGVKTIYKKAQTTFVKFNTNDPFAILQQMDVGVKEKTMTNLCGYSVVFYSIPTVVINASLDEDSKRIVAAHELGHIILHRDILSEGILFDHDMNSCRDRQEYEANLFAADLLISDEDILDNIDTHPDLYSLAGYLEQKLYLLNFKITSMQKRGYNIRPPLPQSSPLEECIIYD